MSRGTNPPGSQDGVNGVISSGICCARRFCEHLTALYAVKCSENMQRWVLPEDTGRPRRMVMASRALVRRLSPEGPLAPLKRAGSPVRTAGGTRTGAPRRLGHA
jgi:hypothetical protein